MASQRRQRRKEQQQEQQLRDHTTNLWISLWSHIVFVTASAVYVAMEVTVLPYYQFYRDVPIEVREALTDDVWWQYYNETDAIPDDVLNATDDYTWYEWYNSTFFDETEMNSFVFKVPNADKKYENPDATYEAWVSQYMIMYFLAATGFLITGALEFLLYSRMDCRVREYYWRTLLSFFMIAAALFGIASSMLVNKDPYGSTILNAISVHLFAIEAIAIVGISVAQCRNRSTGISDDNSDTVTTPTTPLASTAATSTTSIILWMARVSFLIGTCGDVILSYFYLAEQVYLQHAVAAIVTASFWLLCALLYFSVSLYELCLFRRNSNNNQDGDHDTKQQHPEEMEDAKHGGNTNSSSSGGGDGGDHNGPTTERLSSGSATGNIDEEEDVISSASA